MPAVRIRTHPHESTTSAATIHVSAIMSRDVVSVRSGTSLDLVAEVMLARSLTRVPVLDAEGHVVGIVSKTDLVAQAHDAGDTEEYSRPDPQTEELRGFHVEREGKSVEEVMSRSVISVAETATIQRAAQLMVGAQVHGLPVTTASGKLVGFVSSMDVLAWLSGLR